MRSSGRLPGGGVTRISGVVWVEWCRDWYWAEWTAWPGEGQPGMMVNERSGRLGWDWGIQGAAGGGEGQALFSTLGTVGCGLGATGSQ